eukprot:TRINITY_DN26501_c0_g2_i1.p1 TRINITY_DN26501_c0_g2~~TRINITY_DN26501_c0_g2_i1.p1  ORF type:complete len:676 (-),score=119.33 TRINITY_DN26501_c0_g2_i1:168-2195(-)
MFMQQQGCGCVLHPAHQNGAVGPVGGAYANGGAFGGGAFASGPGYGWPEEWPTPAILQQHGDHEWYSPGVSTPTDPNRVNSLPNLGSKNCFKELMEPRMKQCIAALGACGITYPSCDFAGCDGNHMFEVLTGPAHWKSLWSVVARYDGYSVAEMREIPGFWQRWNINGGGLGFNHLDGSIHVWAGPLVPRPPPQQPPSMGPMSAPAPPPVQPTSTPAGVQFAGRCALPAPAHAMPNGDGIFGAGGFSEPSCGAAFCAPASATASAPAAARTSRSETMTFSDMAELAQLFGRISSWASEEIGKGLTVTVSLSSALPQEDPEDPWHSTSWSSQPPPPAKAPPPAVAKAKAPTPAYSPTAAATAPPPAWGANMASTAPAAPSSVGAMPNGGSYSCGARSCVGAPSAPNGACAGTAWPGAPQPAMASNSAPAAMAASAGACPAAAGWHGGTQPGAMAGPGHPMAMAAASSCAGAGAAWPAAAQPGAMAGPGALAPLAAGAGAPAAWSTAAPQLGARAGACAPAGMSMSAGGMPPPFAQFGAEACAEDEEAQPPPPPLPAPLLPPPPPPPPPAGGFAPAAATTAAAIPNGPSMHAGVQDPPDPWANAASNLPPRCAAGPSACIVQRFAIEEPVWAEFYGTRHPGKIRSELPDNGYVVQWEDGTVTEFGPGEVFKIGPRRL